MKGFNDTTGNRSQKLLTLLGRDGAVQKTV